MKDTNWPRVASIALFMGGAIAAMIMHQNMLAATLIGTAGGLAVPQVASGGGGAAPSGASNSVPPVADITKGREG